MLTRDLSNVLLILFLFVLRSSSARPFWVDGEIQQTESTHGSNKKDSLWSNLLGGAKKALSKLFSRSDDVLIDDSETSEYLDFDVANGLPNSIFFSTDELSDIITKANEFIANQKINEALDLFFDTLEENPYILEINYAVGTLLLSLNKFELAEGFLYHAVKISRWKNAPAVANLAQCLLMDGSVDFAEKVSKKGLHALGNKDESGDISYIMGLIKFSVGNYTESADWFLSSAIHNPQNIEAWLRASTMTFPANDRDYRFAENVLLQGLDYNPSNSLLLYHMGLLLHTTNRIEAAIPLYEEAIRLDSSLIVAQGSLATAYHAVRRFQEAENRYKVAIMAESNNTILLANYALLHCNEFKNLVEGRKMLEVALTLDPKSLDVEKAVAACNPILVGEADIHNMNTEL